MDIKKQKLIEAELENYDCYFTSEPSQAFQSLKQHNITQNEIIEVYNKKTGENHPFFNNEIEDLIVKSENLRNKITKWNKDNNHNDKHKNFKVGDKITFLSGYYNNIKYKSEIMGIQGEDIYLLWDCFWFAIKNEKKRNIKLYQ